MKRANYVRYVKGAISNIFGKVNIGEIPGHKGSPEEVMKWKNLPNVTWAKQHLWSLEGSDDQDDTYISRIMNEVFKVEKRTANNCVFVIAVVDLIFDVNIQTTTLTGGMIVQRMNEKLNEKVFSLISNLLNLIFTKIIILYV